MSATEATTPALSLRRRTSRRLSSPVPVSLLGKAAEILGLVALATVLPRVLGAADYGRFALALTVVTLGTVSLTLGGPAVMARFVPAVAPARRAAVARAIGTRLAVGRVAQVALLAAVAAGLATAAPATFPPLHVAIVVAALAVNVAAALALQVGLGLGRTTAWSMRWGLHNAILVAAALPLYAAFGATGAIAALVPAGAAALILGVSAVAGPLRGAPRGAPLPPGTVRFGALQAASGVITQAVHRGGVVAVAVVAGSSVETGYAALAVGIGLAGFYVVSQAFIVSLPGRVAEARARGVAVEAPVRRLAWTALAALVPVAACGAALADPALELTLGAGFPGAAESLTPALAFLVLAPLNGVATQAAALRLRPEATLWGALAGLAAFFVVAVLTVGAIGAPGAVTATLAGTAVAPMVMAARLPGATGRGLIPASLAGVVVVLAAGLAL